MTSQEKQKLNDWLAENIMEWHQVRRSYYHSGIPSYENMAVMSVDHWSPTDNFAQAWEVLEKVMQPPKDLETAKRAPNTKFMLWFKQANLWAMSASEVALAISINAKVAWEGR